MGLLSLFVPPAQAAALLVIPAIGTNIWQMAAGPALAKLARRFAGMIVGVFAGTFATIGLLARTSPLAPALLGLVLAAYGIYGLVARRFEVPRRSERWLSPLVGLMTGLLMGATGVYVVPTVPYLTSLEMEREELVQAIGIAAFVCPLALGLGLAMHGEYRAGLAATSLVALLPALAGMALGQRLRRRLRAAVFTRVFFVGLAALGIYTFLRS
jgi:uncharacterized membrane protein YfcA